MREEHRLDWRARFVRDVAPAFWLQSQEDWYVASA
jgi:hypothetical protein